LLLYHSTHLVVGVLASHAAAHEDCITVCLTLHASSGFKVVISDTGRQYLLVIELQACA
jgi:hypothetical protein